MLTAALWAAPFLILAGCAAYARTALRGHTGSPGPLGCLGRILAARTATAILLAAIAALTVALNTAVLAVRAGRAVRQGWRKAGQPERSRT